MKNLKQIVSVILFLLLAVSFVFNGLYLFGAISRTMTHIGFIVFFAAVFLTALLGLILKDIRKEKAVPVNIFTPVREIGGLYSGLFIAWLITYGIIIIFR